MGGRRNGGRSKVTTVSILWFCSYCNIVVFDYDPNWWQLVFALSFCSSICLSTILIGIKSNNLKPLETRTRQFITCEIKVKLVCQTRRSKFEKKYKFPFSDHIFEHQMTLHMVLCPVQKPGALSKNVVEHFGKCTQKCPPPPLNSTSRFDFLLPRLLFLQDIVKYLW